MVLRWQGGLLERQARAGGLGKQARLRWQPSGHKGARREMEWEMESNKDQGLGNGDSG